nr:receptor-like kinase TMK4 [Tanacetum cinerariifolium]
MNASIMAGFSASISFIPSTGSATNFSVWEGIFCENYNSVASVNLASKSFTETLLSDLNGFSQLSFEMWGLKLLDALNSRKRAYTVFRGEDLNATINSYTS